MNQSGTTKTNSLSLKELKLKQQLKELNLGAKTFKKNNDKQFNKKPK